MKKRQIVNGVITIKVSFIDTFPEEWDEEQIEQFIEKNFKDYIDDDDKLEYEYTTIVNTEVDNYGGDDVYGI